MLSALVDAVENTIMSFFVDRALTLARSDYDIRIGRAPNRPEGVLVEMTAQVDEASQQSFNQAVGAVEQGLTELWASMAEAARGVPNIAWATEPGFAVSIVGIEVAALAQAAVRILGITIAGIRYDNLQADAALQSAMVDAVEKTIVSFFAEWAVSILGIDYHMRIGRALNRPTGVLVEMTTQVDKALLHNLVATVEQGLTELWARVADAARRVPNIASAAAPGSAIGVVGIEVASLAKAAQSSGTSGASSLLEAVEEVKGQQLKELVASGKTYLISEMPSGGSVAAMRLGFATPKAGGLNFPVPDAGMDVGLPQSLLDEILPGIPEGDEVVMRVSTVNFTNGESGRMGAKPKPGQSGEVINVVAAAVIDLALLSGPTLNVSNLVEPIAFTLPANYSKGLVCAFWDEELESWSTQGVKTPDTNAAGAKLECATLHLSLFAALFKGFVDAVLCSQFRLLTKERIGEITRGRWYTALGGATWLGVWFVAFLLMVAACLVDRRRHASRPWRDEFFIITDTEDTTAHHASEEQAEATSRTVTHCSHGHGGTERVRHSSMSAPICAGVAAVCIAVMNRLKAVSNAAKEVLDDLMSNFFEYFGEVRLLIEGAFTDLSWEALHHCHLIAVMHAVTSRLVRSTATRITGARMNYNEDVMQCLLEDVHMKHVAAALQRRGAPDALAARYQLTADGQEEAWDSLYSEVPTHIDSQLCRTSWCNCRLIWDFIVLMSPLGSVFQLSIFMTCKQKMFYLLLDFNGALLLSVAFYSTSGSVKGKQIGEPTCDVPQEAVLQVGRLMALALGSVVLSWVPSALLQSLQGRRLKVLSADRAERAKTLRAWRMQDILVYSLGCLYLGFSSFFVAAFFANLEVEDDQSMAKTTLLTVAQEHAVMPMVFGIAIPLVTHISVRCSAVSRDDHIRAVRSSFYRRAPALVVDI